jgi:hypothetical protein
LPKADVWVTVDDGATWQRIARKILNLGAWLWKTPPGSHDRCWIFVTLWQHEDDDDSDVVPAGGGHGGEERDVVYAQGISDSPFTIGMPVPTRLKSFDVAMEDGAAVLRWETGVEVGMDGFRIVRSTEEQGTYGEITKDTIAARGEASGARYEYRDDTVRPNQTYWYKLQEVTPDGPGAEFGPYAVTFKIAFGLEQNVPNPFNPTTTIKYSIAADSDVRLVVYDVTGRTVRTLVDERQRADVYRVAWDGVNDQGERVASGMYFCKLVAGKFTQTRKMMLLK